MTEKEIRLIEHFLSGNFQFDEIAKESYLYELYSKSNIKELKISYTEIIEQIKYSGYVEVFLESMQKIYRDKLYDSFIHGINHNIRVSLFVLIICVYENIPLEDFKLLLEAAKYHDIGRVNDSYDLIHGLRSSKRLDFLDNEYSEIDIILLKIIITCHSLDDDVFYSLLNEEITIDVERSKKLFQILKDADGLDRARLPYQYADINVELLRTETAKKLVPFAYKLFNSYEKNLIQDFQLKKQFSE